MNIFYLDKDPIAAARFQCNKHVVKMALETAQILSTVHYILRTDYITGPHPLYKPTHVNHPCVKWAASSLLNYSWLLKHGLALGDEYSHRFDGRYHKSMLVMTSMQDWEEDNWEEFSSKFSSHDFTDPPLCMPAECKVRIVDGKLLPNDPVAAYREYYAVKWGRITMQWTERRMPGWLYAILDAKFKAQGFSCLIIHNG